MRLWQRLFWFGSALVGLILFGLGVLIGALTIFSNVGWF